MPTPKRHVLAVVSDIHCGSSVALCCPEPVELDDGVTVHPSPVQQWLWEQWTGYWRRVAAVAKGADSLTVLVTGDAVEGDHHNSLQVISKDPAVQLWILKKCFAPVLALKPDRAVIVRGTETHVGRNGSSEEAFARWLRGEGLEVPKSGDGMYSWWNFDGLIGDCHISAAHHGRLGARPWTRSGVVGNLAAQIVMERANEGQPIPDLAFRGHLHTFHDTHQSFRTRLIQMPAWQLHTAYAYRVVPEVLSDIGGVIATITPGQPAVIEPVLHKPARPKMVRLA